MNSLKCSHAWKYSMWCLTDRNTGSWVQWDFANYEVERFTNWFELTSSPAPIKMEKPAMSNKVFASISVSVQQEIYKTKNSETTIFLEESESFKENICQWDQDKTWQSFESQHF